MKRKKYTKEPKRLKLKWAVRFNSGSVVYWFQTKKEALGFIRGFVKKGHVLELFKLQSNFIEAWTK